METLKIKPLYPAVCLIISFLLFPAVLTASDSISLADREKKLIDQGEIIVREVDTFGKDGRTFEAIGLINAPRGTILQVLLEYKKYPEFMPNVSHIEIIEHTGNESVVNYTLSLPVGKIKKYRVRITVTEPERQPSMIQWQLENWPGLKAENTIKDTSGFWCIEEQTQNRSLVLYHVFTDPGPIPFGLGWIVDILSKNSVPEVFLQTNSRTEKIAINSASGTEIKAEK